MKKRLVLIIKEKTIDLLLGMGKIVIASRRENYCTIRDLKDMLQNFMRVNNIKPQELENLLFIMDFTYLLPDIPPSSLGYIQIGSSTPHEQFKIEKSFANIDLNIYNLYLLSTDSRETQAKLANFIAYLSDKGIDKIAINNAFANFNEEREKSVISALYKMGKGKFKIFPSHIYNVSNYLVRENMLFLNLLLYNEIKKVMTSILEILQELTINSPLFFLQGNGTLTNLEGILASPINSWQSLLASSLIGASLITGEKDCFVLTEQKNNFLQINMVQKGTPRCSTPFAYLHGLTMPPYYPWRKEFELAAKNNDLKNVLEQNNLYSGQIPVISFLDSVKDYWLFPYELMPLENNLAIMAAGAFQAQYQLEITSTTQDMSPDALNKTKKILKQKSDTLLTQHNIQLGNITYDYCIIPVKYNLQNVSTVRLRVNGEI